MNNNLINNIINQNKQQIKNNITNKTTNIEIDKINKSPHELTQINFRSNKYKNQQVKLLESKIANDLNEVSQLLKQEQDNVYFRNWKLLEKGFRKNRISHYLNSLKIKDDCNHKQLEELKILLFKNINNKSLDKLIVYNTEEGYIIEIKNLEFDINTGYKLKFNTDINKTKK